MSENSFVLRDGRTILVIGAVTGLIKHRVKNEVQFCKIWIKENIKNKTINMQSGYLVKMGMETAG